MNKTLWIVVLSVFFSCSEKGRKAIVFKKEYSITGEVILQDQYNITGLYVVDTLLLARLKSKDYWFSVFQSKSLKKIGDIAKKGAGPEEFNGSLRYCQTDTTNQNQIKIWVYDMNACKYHRLNLSGGPLIDKEIELNAKLNFHKVFYIDATKLVGNTSNLGVRMNRLQIYNPKTGKLIKVVPPFPKVKNKNQDLAFLFYRYNHLYVNSFGMKPDKKKFVSAMSAFNRIDIFNDKGDLEKTIFGKEKFTKKAIDQYLTAKDVKKTKLKKYYMGVYASDSYIYTLYYGQLSADYGEKFIPIQIRIFDWEGRPMAKITVPDYLLDFSVDEKNGNIYGVDYYNEKILRYNIKQIADEL